MSAPVMDISSCKIRSWRVSYYQNDKRQWVYGQLKISPCDIRFHLESVTRYPRGNSQSGDQQNPPSESDPGESSEDLILQYTDIKQVRKAASMLVFPAVTLQTCDGNIHWFSSLPDRHSVFNAVDYFSRHALLESGKDVKKVASDATVKTSLGQQLLRSAEDSERTLAAAAAGLHGQGRQLDRAAVQMMEMHEDLDAADRLLSGLNTYLGQWSLPPQYTPLDIVHITKDDVPSVENDLEVLSSELSKDYWRPQQLSFLRVTESTLVLLNTRQRPLHTFRWMDLSRIYVVSPWEVVMTKREAGRPSVSVSVVSSQLLPVLTLMERKVSHLMDFNRAEHVVTPSQPSSGRQPGAQRESTAAKILSSKHTHGSGPGKDTADSAHRDSQGPPTSSSSSPPQVQKTTQEEQQRVSSEEVLLLCDKLGSLKSMARAVGEELTDQNAALDDLMASVDHADARVCDATRRTKKLM